MENLILLLKMIACLVAGMAVGNWFLSKAREGHLRGDPWYKTYVSVPGLIVLSALLALPVILWLTGRGS